MKDILSAKIKKQVKESIREEIETKIKFLEKELPVTEINWQIRWSSSYVWGDSGKGETYLLQNHKNFYFSIGDKSNKRNEMILNLFKKNKSVLEIYYKVWFKLSDGIDRWTSFSFNHHYDFKTINRNELLEKLGI